MCAKFPQSSQLCIQASRVAGIVHGAGSRLERTQQWFQNETSNDSLFQMFLLFLAGLAANQSVVVVLYCSTSLYVPQITSSLGNLSHHRLGSLEVPSICR